MMRCQIHLEGKRRHVLIRDFKTEINVNTVHFNLAVALEGVQYIASAL
jgi:hypothetical protein